MLNAATHGVLPARYSSHGPEPEPLSLDPELPLEPVLPELPEPLASELPLEPALPLEPVPLDPEPPLELAPPVEPAAPDVLPELPDEAPEPPVLPELLPEPAPEPSVSPVVPPLEESFPQATVTAHTDKAAIGKRWRRWEARFIDSAVAASGWTRHQKRWPPGEAETGVSTTQATISFVMRGSDDGFSRTPPLHAPMRALCPPLAKREVSPR